jgi:release factor glutamine methyltransferase
MTIREANQWGFEQLTPTSDSPRLDAELLLAHVLKKSSTFLFAHDEGLLDRVPFFPLHWWRYQRLIRLRKQGIPVAYLVGHREFYFLDFKVNRHVLVPRPDTELLVEAVIEYLRAKKAGSSKLGAGSPILIDVGTGSGCIPISILKNEPNLTAVATDISWQALRVAKANARKHHVQDRLRLVWSDLLENIDPAEFEDSEVIVTANLPYLPDMMEVQPELTFEPAISLYGGKDGVKIINRLLSQIQAIRPCAIFLELFDWQIHLLDPKDFGYEVRSVIRMSGDARCLILERK